MKMNEEDIKDINEIREMESNISKIEDSLIEAKLELEGVVKCFATETAPEETIIYSAPAHIQNLIRKENMRDYVALDKNENIKKDEIVVLNIVGMPPDFDRGIPIIHILDGNTGESRKIKSDAYVFNRQELTWEKVEKEQE